MNNGRNIPKHTDPYKSASLTTNPEAPDLVS